MDEGYMLETAIRAAREAGQVALANLHKPQKLRIKGLRDFVTDGVVEVQDKITEVISQEFPNHSFLTEEGNETPEVEEGLQWIIDPIDGSTNYHRGLFPFAISIALRRGVHPLLGVVYDPYHDDLFRAQRRHGAFLNDKPLRISTEDELEMAVVGTDWPRAVDKRAEHIRVTEVMLGEVITLRTLGSPALGLCYVAAGYLEAYYHLSLNLWDVAAAAVIIEEAGGDVSDEQGGPWIYSPGGYVAANKHIHRRVLRIVSGVLQALAPPRL
ncbi:MAG: inositol monophosphatase family protein [Anaerolineae bacterium]